VAVIVAAGCALALFALAAIVVDLGLARDTRRQAQNAADASALAAANALYLDSSMSTAGRIAAAVAAAKAYARANYGVEEPAWASCADPDHLPHTAGTPCISFDDAAQPKEVRVRVPVKATPALFGAIAGISEIEVGASAQAMVEPGVRRPERGLRPWGICSKVVTTTGQVVFVPMKGGSTSAKAPNDGCGSEGPPGGWWVAQCNGQGNGTGDTEEAVLLGCPTSGYAPVPGQPASGGQAIYEHLTDVCTKKAENLTCLASDTGNNFHNASEEWQTLVGHTIQMPVFCFPPECSEGAYSAQGANASYAIYKLATVEICGFEFPPRAPSTGWPTSGPCATANPNGFHSSDVVAGGGLFMVVKGLTGGPSQDWAMEEEAVSLGLSL
jgi:hypothetical protein